VEANQGRHLASSFLADVCEGGYFPGVGAGVWCHGGTWEGSASP
jgi:hypothetical protein